MSDIISALNSNGSGIDFISLGNQLASAEVEPRRNIVQGRIDDIDVSVTALGEAKSLLSDTQSALRVITDEPLMQTTSSSSAITATVTDTSLVEAGTENLDVLALAQEQVLQFTGFTSEDAVVQGGTIDIEFGVWTADEPPVFYDAGDRPAFEMVVADGTTLSELSLQFDSISGVESSIIDIGDGTYTLGILSATGAQSGMRFTSTATGAAADVDIMEFDTTADISTHQIRGASDALLEYNGITVYRASNEIDDLISGVTLELNDTTTAPATLSTAVEYEEALARVQVLVNQINTTLEYLDQQTSRGVLDGSDPGQLVGETSIEALKDGIRSLMRSEITGFGDDSYYLSDFGMEYNLQGTIDLDEDKFAAAVNENPQAIFALFESTTTTNNPDVAVSGFPPSDTPSGTYEFRYDEVNDQAFLGSTELTSLFPGDGVTFYLASSGPMSGTSYTVPDGVDSFEVTFGRSFADQLLTKVQDAMNGSISARETDLSTSRTENEEELEELDTRLETLQARYNERFTAMENAITALNNTGSYIENLVNAWAAEAN